MKRLTRRNKLADKIKLELTKSTPNIETILTYVDDYEKDNLDTIVRLRKNKEYDVKRINGGLKQTIDAHGPITKILIGSASKRIYGALLDNTDKPIKRKFNYKWFLIWLASFLITLGIIFIK